MTHCCDTMERQVEFHCDHHPDPFSCPDALIFYSDTFDEYGIIVHDGGPSYVCITHCPWCGSRLPESQRDRWFEELAALGFDQPLGQEEIPREYKSGEWRRRA